MLECLFALFARPAPLYTRGPIGSPPPAPPDPGPSRNFPFLSPGTIPLINGMIGATAAFVIAVVLLFASSRPEIGVSGGIFGAVVGAVIIGGFLFAFADRIVNSLIEQASGILFAPFGIRDEAFAFAFLYQYLVYHQAPILLVTNGAIDPRCKDSPLTKMGNRGPGFVQVDAVSVVLVEHSVEEPASNVTPGFRVTTKVMRTLTMGQHFIDEHETIRGYVDLKLHEEQLPLKNVVTKDGISLDIDLRIYFRVGQNQGELVHSGQYLASRNAVKLAVLGSSDWKFQTKVTAESTIRDYFARFVFNDIQGAYPFANRLFLLDYDDLPERKIPENAPRATIQIELMSEINQAIARWGSQVVTIGIDQITVPTEVKATLHRAWIAAWDNKMAFEKADTNARVLKRNSEGNRDAAEIERNANILSAQGKAEADKITAQAEGERERLKAEAEAQARRTKMSAQTDLHVEYIKRLEETLSAKNIVLDNELIKQLLLMLREYSPEARYSRRRGKEYYRDELPTEHVGDDEDGSE